MFRCLRHAENHYCTRLLIGKLVFYVVCVLITARKRSLRRLCFYSCVSVHRGGMRGCGGCAWLQGGGHVWLWEDVHGCGGGWACVVVGGCAWLWGACMVGGRGCMVVGGMCGCGGAWLQGACMVAGGHAWDTTRYGQWAGGTHPTGMHSCYIRSYAFSLRSLDCLSDGCTKCQFYDN